jgi:hypothetical protein
MQHSHTHNTRIHCCTRVQHSHTLLHSRTTLAYTAALAYNFRVHWRTHMRLVPLQHLPHDAQRHVALVSRVHPAAHHPAPRHPAPPGTCPPNVTPAAHASRRRRRRRLVSSSRRCSIEPICRLRRRRLGRHSAEPRCLCRAFVTLPGRQGRQGQPGIPRLPGQPGLPGRVKRRRRPEAATA